jgi:formylglycine-generating enzyme required for sulfatase activity
VYIVTGNVLRVSVTPPPGDIEKATAAKAGNLEPGPASTAVAKSPPPATPADTSPRKEPEDITTAAGQIKLKLIPAGEFMMGSDGGQGDSDEHPRHKVVITRPFYLGIHELTQAQYEAVIGQNPSYFSPTGAGKDKVAGASTDAHPVESVSWLDAVRFCNKLSEKEGLRPFYRIDGEDVIVLSWSGEGYRLPTEAEWEYPPRRHLLRRGKSPSTSPRSAVGSSWS